MTRSILAGAVAGVALLAGCGERRPVDNMTAEMATSEPGPAVTASAWAGLSDDVGKYPRDIGLFETSVISDDLKALLGDEFGIFKTNTQVQGTLSEEGGVLWTSGNKPHEGGSEAAYLLIDTAAEQLEVGLWHDGDFHTYTSPGAAIPKPADVQTMIDNARNLP